MAYSPIAFTAANYRDYKNYWLKAYEPGTTTPVVMATDSTLSTFISKSEVNVDGFLVSAGNALIIPYVNGTYDLWLFPTEAEAEANNTSNALRLADSITGAADLAEAVALAPVSETVTLIDGQTVVTFTAQTTAGAEFHINGQGLDSRLLTSLDINEGLTTLATITLFDSYPAGALVTLSKNTSTGSAVVTTVEEEVVLTDGQTVVTFSTLTTESSEFHINGIGVDSRLLSSEDINQSLTTPSTITLFESYPAGSIVTLAQNSTKGSINVDITNNIIKDLSQAYEFDTLQDAIVSTVVLPVGKVLNLKERSTGNGGGATWDVVLSGSVTENGYNIVQCTGVPTLSLVLRIGEFILDTQWGVPRDGSDGSVQLQNFLNYWRDNQVDAQLDKGDININTPLLIEFTANSIPLKKLKGNASRILSNLTVASPLLRIVSSAVVRNIDIDSITFRGEHGVSTETSLLELDGGDGSAGPLGQYMYNMVLSNNRFENSNGHGLHILNNVFEVNIISCFARATQNTTGKGFFFEFGAAGNPSSIELIACVTAGWFNGVHVDSPVEDAKITGGTFILAQAHGVKLSNNNNSMVTNIHVENNWEGAADLNSGGAGIKAENSSILTGVYGTTNSKQKYVVDLYCTGKKNAIIGGSGSGSIVKYANINGAANSSLTFMNDSEFDIVSNDVTILRIADAKIKVGENLRDSTIELSKSSDDNSRLKIRRWTGVAENYQNFEMITTGQQLNFNTGAAAVVGAEVVDQTMLSLGFGTVPRISFYGATPIVRQDVTGSKGANAALTDLILKLTNLGIITDSTS